MSHAFDIAVPIEIGGTANCAEVTRATINLLKPRT